MSSKVENPLAEHPEYLRARDVLAKRVLSGAVRLDLRELVDESMRLFNLSHQHAHELADQFMIDLKIDRRAHEQHAD